MAPPAFADPDRDVRIALAYLRRRGLSFDEAWDQALSVAGWTRDTRLRRIQRETLKATRPEWQAAYEGRPTGFSRHFTVLLAVIEEAPEAPVAGRRPGTLVA